MTFNFTIARNDQLLTAAQLLFCVLPLASLWTMKNGAPMILQAPRAIACGCGIVAFAILTCMFSLEEHGLGVALCATNLSLRLIEAARYVVLCSRGTSLCTKIQGDLGTSLTEGQVNVQVDSPTACCCVWPATRIW